VSPTEQFGTNLRIRREALGLSQEEAASRAGLHRTYLGSVERGERNICLINIAKIALALKCSAADLMQRVEWQR